MSSLVSAIVQGTVALVMHLQQQKLMILALVEDLPSLNGIENLLLLSFKIAYFYLSFEQMDIMFLVCGLLSLKYVASL